MRLPLGVRQRHEQLEHAPSGTGVLLRQLILGGQDGLVNVLGVLLGVAAGTANTSIVIIAGVAAAFAESISMAAVAYTSARASQDHYNSQLEQEKREINEVPDVERMEIQLIYYKKGFRGKALESVVDKICSDKKLWLDTMMKEEIGLYESGSVNPKSEAIVVGVSAGVGSLLPLWPFLIFSNDLAILASFAFSIAVLALAGIIKAKMTDGVWYKAAFEMAVIGGLAAAAGYAVGTLLGIRA